MPRVRYTSDADPFRSTRDFDNGVPGPGKYNGNRSASVPQAAKFSLRNRTSTAVKSATAVPSPNKYRNEKRIQTEANRFTMRRRYDVKGALPTPGPSKYPADHGINDVDIAFSFRYKSEFEEKEWRRNAPNTSPSKYRAELFKSVEHNQADVTCPARPRFSFRAKQFKNTKDSTPAPGKYNVQPGVEVGWAEPPHFTMRGRCAGKEVQKDPAWMKHNQFVSSNDTAKQTFAPRWPRKADTMRPEKGMLV